MALDRTLGLPMLTFYGTGMILGAGVYSVIGKAAGIAGEGLWLGFVLAGIAAVLTALSYAELATLFPKAGAEYTYLRHTFPKYRGLSATVGLTVLFAGFSSAAAVALAFGSYLQYFIDIPRYFLALALLIIFTGVNILGIRQSSWTNAIFTLLEVSGLLLFIWLGWQHPHFGEALLVQPSLETISSAALIIFAFLGFENIVSLAEETKKPEITIPRAILLSLGISVLLYVLVSLAAVALMPPELLATSDSALIDASLKSSPQIACILGGIALFSTANTTLIGLISTSRILYGISKDGSLPKVLSKTLNRRKTPWIAALIALGCATIMLFFAKVELLASIASFTTMIVFIFINASVIRLRLREPKTYRPFKIPLSVGNWPLLPTLGIATCIALCLQFSQVVYLTGFLAFGGSAIFYYLYRWSTKNIKIFDQKPQD